MFPHSASVSAIAAFLSELEKSDGGEGREEVREEGEGVRRQRAREREAAATADHEEEYTNEQKEAVDR